MTGPSRVLGLSCFYHDSAACLMQGGRVTAAAQEERFTRRKNAADFPIQAINFCLQEGGITARDLDAVVFYEKPYLKLSRVLAGHLRGFPRTFASFRRTMPHWLGDRLTLPLDLQSELGFSGKTYFIRHHAAHAASAFLTSGFEEAAILTADSVGEWATATRGRGAGAKVRVESELVFPDSLGLLYSAVTAFLGFEANEGEGTVMGLAAYGRASFLPRLREIVAVREDGSFALDQSYFDFYGDEAMHSPRFAEAFGPARLPGGPVTDRDRDLAASLQALTEDILVRLARDLRARTKSDSLCLAGGVFLNCSANQKILENAGFKRVFVQPAAGDAGGALGAAAFVSHSLWGLPRSGTMDPYLGPAFPAARVKRALAAAGLSWKELPEDELCGAAAGAIARGAVLGWVQGRMELGPRALGNRSILADPRDARTKDLINARVKGREEFRPFAPAVLAERAAEFFHLDAPSPFMLLAPRVREEKKAAIPAVTHVDGTARVQTVTAEANPRFHRLLKAFDRAAGVPVLVNTSFNRRGEPIVCSPEDAIACFKETGLDALVLGDLFVERHGPA
jgi:carbamoyltransferase